MSGPALDVHYRYPHLSQLDRGAGAPALSLATTHVPAGQSWFFRGTLRQPRLTADLLLALVRVVGSRYHIPPAMLARIIAEADPVVTCAEDRLRFEGFSACCGAYARVDLLPEAVEGSLLGPGTTNVDFNPPMRVALTTLRDTETVRLAVGQGEVELERASETVVERKVALPLRWIKGLLNVQAVQSRLQLRAQIGGLEARRFLRSLPRQGTHGRPAWVVTSGAGLRLSQIASKGAVRVGGLERLRILEEVSRHARTLRIYGSDTEESSAWELDTGSARFHLVLSPEVWRGFSGEGAALMELAYPEASSDTEAVRSALRWQSRLEPAQLGRECELPPERMARVLARLAASGVVGYDLSQSAYFHRELPFDIGLVETLEPRIREARKLVGEDGVRLGGTEGGVTEAWVRGSGVEHRVRLSTDGARCSCPWFARHPGDRGPCKHILAAQIVTGGGEDEEIRPEAER